MGDEGKTSVEMVPDEKHSLSMNPIAMVGRIIIISISSPIPKGHIHLFVLIMIGKCMMLLLAPDASHSSSESFRQISSLTSSPKNICLYK